MTTNFKMKWGFEYFLGNLSYLLKYIIKFIYLVTETLELIDVIYHLFILVYT